MEHTADEFIEVILSDPESEAPYLVYADWLQENGNEPRAAFIRSQIEYERANTWLFHSHPNYNTPEEIRAHSASLQAAQKTYTELLQKHETEWRAGPRCEKCSGTGDSRGMKLTHTFERCPDCSGTGDAGGLMDWVGVPGHEPSIAIDWRRGFMYRVACDRLTDAIDENTGSTRWAVQVLTTPPERRLIRQIVPADCRPDTNTPGLNISIGRTHEWVDGRAVGPGPSVVPHALFVEIKGSAEYEVPALQVYVEFRTHEAAISAIGTAIVNLIRSRI